MANHAKPSRVAALATRGAVAGAVLALGSTGLAATGSPAYAGGDPSPRRADHDGKHHAKHHGKHHGKHHDKKVVKKKVVKHYEYNYNRTYNYTYNVEKSSHGHGGEVHNSNGLANFSDNNVQAILQACNNDVPVNVLGVQVLVDNLTGALGIGSQGTSADADNSENCGQSSHQQDGDNTVEGGNAYGQQSHGGGGEYHNSNGLVNFSDNNVQVPLQACNNDVPVNVGGVFFPAVQVLVDNLTGALGIGSQDTRTSADNSRNCGQGQGQQDGDNSADFGGQGGGTFGPTATSAHAAKPAPRAKAAKSARHAKRPTASQGGYSYQRGAAKAGGRHAKPQASAYGGNGSGNGSEFHNSNGLVNVSDNNVQVPLQGCNNVVPVNVLGVQVIVDNVTGALGLASQGTEATANNSRNCEQGSSQQDGDSEGFFGGYSEEIIFEAQPAPGKPVEVVRSAKKGPGADD